MTRYVVGVDLGGTQIRAVLASENAAVHGRRSVHTSAHEGPEAVLNRIRSQIDVVRQGNSIEAIGIGAPGPTDPYNGIVMMAPNLPGWRNVKLARYLGRCFDVPVYVGNDANLACLAEHRYGAGIGCHHMIYVTVSTGVGTGIIVDDRMVLGRHGLAAEIGHMTIDVHAEQLGDNVVGTLEGLASGPNIARRARAALKSGAASKLIEMVEGGIDEVTPALLGQAAQAGDEFSLNQFRIAGWYLGVGITNMIHVFNPERIVLGGSVWLHCKQFMVETIWETIEARAESPEYWKTLHIMTAELGDDVGLLGAVALAFDSLPGDRAA